MPARSMHWHLKSSSVVQQLVCPVDSRAQLHSHSSRHSLLVGWQPAAVACLQPRSLCDP